MFRNQNDPHAHGIEIQSLIFEQLNQRVNFENDDFLAIETSSPKKHQHYSTMDQLLKKSHLIQSKNNCVHKKQIYIFDFSFYCFNTKSYFKSI